MMQGRQRSLQAFMCVKLERPRSSENWKKSSVHTCIGVGKLNKRPVKVLQDTGCTEMIVDMALDSDAMVIPGSAGSPQMVDHTLIDVPLANVNLDSLYYRGHCRVMCVSFPYTL